MMADEHPAASPERQTSNMTFLRGIRGRNVNTFRRARPASYRHAADLCCRSDIGFQKSRRYGQRVRLVVEAVAGIVDRKKFLGIHFKPEQIIDRVRILGSIEPVHS